MVVTPCEASVSVAELAKQKDRFDTEFTARKAARWLANTALESITNAVAISNRDGL